MDTFHMPCASRTSPAGQRILTRLRTIGPFLAGSLTITTKRCGKPTCRCVEAGPIHEAAVLTWKEEGTTRTLHVPRALRDEVAAWVAEGQRLKELSREMTLAQRAFLIAQRTARSMRPRTRPLTFADVELQAQGITLDATLQALSDFLDAHEDLVTLVHQDLVRGLKRPRAGARAWALPRCSAPSCCNGSRPGISAKRERVADGYTLRRFTTFDARPVPKHDAFHRAFCRLTPATVRALNDAVIQAAVALGLEDGARLRVDTDRGGDRHPLAGKPA